MQCELTLFCYGCHSLAVEKNSIMLLFHSTAVVPIDNIAFL